MYERNLGFEHRRNHRLLFYSHTEPAKIHHYCKSFQLMKAPDIGMVCAINSYVGMSESECSDYLCVHVHNLCVPWQSTYPHNLFTLLKTDWQHLAQCRATQSLCHCTSLFRTWFTSINLPEDQVYWLSSPAIQISDRRLHQTAVWHLLTGVWHLLTGVQWWHE